MGMQSDINAQFKLKLQKKDEILALALNAKEKDRITALINQALKAEVDAKGDEVEAADDDLYAADEKEPVKLPATPKKAKTAKRDDAEPSAQESAHRRTNSVEVDSPSKYFSSKRRPPAGGVALFPMGGASRATAATPSVKKDDKK